MKSRSLLPVLAIGFGVLIVLIAVLGLSAIRRAEAIYRDMRIAQDSYSEMETLRRSIMVDIYLADVLVRDYLLDPSPENAPVHRQELIALRSSLEQRLASLTDRNANGDDSQLVQLRKEIEAYWDSLDPIFAWTPQEKADRSFYFLRHSVLPHRDAVTNLAREVARLNSQYLESERQRLQNSRDAMHTFLLQMMAVALIIGIAVAVLTTYRVWRLERRIGENQDDLRRLSQRLVQAQEVERRALSRELHDEVGQTMTALGILLGNLESKGRDESTFRTRIDDAKRLNASAMRALRDLAMGLRPSMLDDLGLQAALEWQGREFFRHTGVHATVDVAGVLDDLSDAQRTCIYRVVQEALTNCARHAQARNVSVSVRAQEKLITVVVQDDGIGFKSPESVRGGIGLIGIKERVQSLDGKVLISSEPRKGTLIQVSIPSGLPA